MQRAAILHAVLASMLVCAAAASAAAGDPDPSFGVGGETTTPIASQAPYVAQTEIDSQGRIVVALEDDLSDGEPGDFSAVRYLPNGILDTSFGEAGVATIDVGGSGDSAQALAIDDEDRVLIGGYAHSALGRTGRVPLVRLSVDGNVDTSFGDAGFASGLPTRSFNNAIGTLAIDSNDDIVASGIANGKRTIMRFTPNGQADPDFKRTDLGPVLGRLGGLFGIVAGPGQNITASGSSGHASLVVQVNRKGKLNPRFSQDGVREYLGKARSTAYDLAVVGRGKMVLAGSRVSRTSPTKGETVFSVFRISGRGEPDRSFAHRGSKYFGFCVPPDRDGDCFSYATSIDENARGELIVAGIHRGVRTRIGLAAARLRPQGRLDRTFADGGKLTTDGLNDASVKSTVDPEGRLVSAAASFDFEQPTHHRLTVSRFEP